MNFNSLPDEILIEIFKYLPIKVRCRLRIVCRRWKQFCLFNIDQLQFVGKVSENWDYVVDQRTQYWQANSLLNVEVCGNPCEKVGLCFIIQKAANCLKKIAFKSCLRAELTNEEECGRALIQFCPNVTHINFQSYGAVSFQLFTSFLKVYGNQLNEFSLLFNYEERQNLAIDLLFQHLNSRVLRKISFQPRNDQHLKRLSNHFPYLTFLYLHDCANIDFMPLKQFKCLQVFTVYLQIGQFNNLDWMPADDWKETLTTLNLNIDFHVSPIKEMNPLKQLNKLKHLDIRIMYCEQLCFICDHLVQLESLNIAIWTQDPLPCMPDISKMTRLISLTFDYVYDHQDYWPFKLLDGIAMKSVRFFKFESFDKSDEDEYMRCVNRLIQNLPTAFPNLHTLSLSTYWIELETLCEILDKLSQLKRLLGYFENEEQEYVDKVEEFCQRKGIVTRI